LAFKTEWNEKPRKQARTWEPIGDCVPLHPLLPCLAPHREMQAWAAQAPQQARVPRTTCPTHHPFCSLPESNALIHINPVREKMSCGIINPEKDDFNHMTSILSGIV